MKKEKKSVIMLISILSNSAEGLMVFSLEQQRC